MEVVFNLIFWTCELYICENPSKSPKCIKLFREPELFIYPHAIMYRGYYSYPVPLRLAPYTKSIVH